MDYFDKMKRKMIGDELRECGDIRNMTVEEFIEGAENFKICNGRLIVERKIGNKKIKLNIDTTRNE